MPLFRYVNISEVRKLVWEKLDRTHPYLKPEVRASIYGFLWLYVEQARVVGKDQGWMYCSVDFLAERLNRTPNQIRWLLEKILKKSEIIKIKTTSRGTAIRFRNYWEIFLSTKPKTTNETTSKPQTNHNVRGTGEVGESLPSPTSPPDAALAASPSGGDSAPVNGEPTIKEEGDTLEKKKRAASEQIQRLRAKNPSASAWRGQIG